MSKRFKTRIVEIEATQFTGDNFAEMHDWTGGFFRPLDDWDATGEFTGQVYDKLHASWIAVAAGQWIVRGVKGEYYPCDNETFFWKYEEINDSSSD